MSINTFKCMLYNIILLKMKYKSYILVVIISILFLFTGTSLGVNITTPTYTNKQLMERMPDVDVTEVSLLQDLVDLGSGGKTSSLGKTIGISIGCIAFCFGCCFLQIFCEEKYDIECCDDCDDCDC